MPQTVEALGKGGGYEVQKWLRKLVEIHKKMKWERVSAMGKTE